MPPLIENVPNISEGRDPTLWSAIEAGFRSEGLSLRFQSFCADSDHNRSVITLIDTAENLKAAIRVLYRCAVERIDLRQHEGVHPRMGAVDVAPFIPFSGATMGDCIRLSREVSAMIAEEFGVPTYLYAQSATREERRALANIRRGGFEGLTEKMARPEWKPDFGPSVPHPTAGVSAVGARDFLIAFNLNLNSEDIKIAKDIARAVRASSGGLPYLQAIGLHLEKERCIQVSMNLLNFRATPLHGVYRRVKEEAAKRGVTLRNAEVIGFAPVEALQDAQGRAFDFEGLLADREMFELPNPLAAFPVGNGERSI